MQTAWFACFFRHWAARRVLLQRPGGVLGAVVDAVAGVVPLTADAAKPAPQFASPVDSAFVSGIAALGDRMPIMVGIASLLSSAEMDLVARVAQYLRTLNGF